MLARAWAIADAIRMPPETLVRSLIAIAFAFALAGSALAGQPPAAAPLEATLSTIDDLLGEWAEQRAQTIEVQDIEGIDAAAADDGLEQLQRRLRSLLTKKRSNREWHGYWRGEARITDALLEAYERAAPVEGEGPLDARVTELASQRAAAAEALHEASLRVQRVRDGDAAARAALAQTLADLREELPRLSVLIDEQGAALAAANEPIPGLEAAVEAADDDDARAAAQEALDEAVARRDEAADAIETTRDRRGRAERLAAFLEILLEGETLPGETPPAPPEVVSRIETLRDTRAALAEAEDAEEAASAVHQGLSERLTRKAHLQEAFRQRREALRGWRDLARDKMANQDVYLEAIDGDIDAVEDRLRGIAAEEPGQRVGTSATACETERRRDETPLTHYQACRRATLEEIRDFHGMLEEISAAHLLNSRQEQALERLLAAQERDVVLVDVEHAVARAEAERAREHEGADPEWTEAWQILADRARAKRGQLAAALQTSKDTRRALKVNEAFFESEKQSIGQRIERLEAQLEERTATGRFFRALLGTAWHFLRNAYLVPIYILLAWLLLRFSRRVIGRLVTAKQSEAPTRDQAQRIQTLGDVARAGIRLIVVIATALLCLQATGVDIGPILGGAAIFGLAISFGSQSLVKDFVTGFFILLENQYAVGDFVDVGGNAGIVEAITMRRTILRDLSGRVHHIPNGSITKLINNTQGWSRVVMHVGVAYGTDLGKVEEIVNRLGEAMYADPEWSERLEEPPRYIGLIRFGDSSLDIRIMFKTRIFEQWAAEHQFNRRLKDAFEDEGIVIPFPQRDLHLMTPVRLDAPTERDLGPGGEASKT